jgi:SAM-dependent methyltransferase
MIQRLSPYLPLTYADIIARSLKGCRNILDVGCGRGGLMSSVERRVNAHAVGLDLYLPYLIEAKKKRSHDDFILADVRYIPLRAKSFDCVLCSQVIEHLERREGLRLISNVENIVRFKVIIGTPRGAHTPSDRDACINPFQEHRSFYLPFEFLARGYKVRGQGLELIYGDGGIKRLSKSLMIFFTLISYIFSPLTYFAPNIASHMICVKSNRK